jgi:hypothetical protein
MYPVANIYTPPLRVLTCAPVPFGRQASLVKDSSSAQVFRDSLATLEPVPFISYRRFNYLAAGGTGAQVFTPRGDILSLEPQIRL